MVRMPGPEFTRFCQYVLTALALGCAIGFERQWRNSVAGLRTNVLVAVGAAVFVLSGSGQSIPDARIAAQIVSGIGFIGGGAILREGLTIRGVNTAATLWCTAAIGVLCGMGMLAEAAVAAGVILFSNTVLRPLTYAMRRKVAMRTNIVTTYACKFTCAQTQETRLRKRAVHCAKDSGLLVRAIHSAAAADGAAEVTVTVSAETRNDAAVEKLMALLNEDDAVSAISWEALEHSGDSE